MRIMDFLIASRQVFLTRVFQNPPVIVKKTCKRSVSMERLQKVEIGRSEEQLPNILFVQLESFFDPTEVEWLQFSEDPIPNLRKMFSEYSSGYFKAPSVGAGTANTEFEVLTGMSMRFFGPGRISI